MSLEPSNSAGPFAAAPPPPVRLPTRPRPAPPEVPARPRVLIEPESAGVRLGLHDLWAYRELLYFLTWRDVKVRYKQTLIGAAWVVVQPLCLMLIVTLIFNKIGGLTVAEMPYPLFAYAGLLLWTFFANAISNSTGSLIQNTNLITKVYFPRMFIPAAATAAGLVDFAVAALILGGLAVYYHVPLTWRVLLLPGFVALTVLLALGVGLLISALTVKYRDLRHVLPFLLQFWFFASPVVYPLSRAQGRWALLLSLNPMAGLLEGFRAALMGRAVALPPLAVAGTLTLVLLVAGVYVFRRTEDTFADLI